MYSFSVKPTVNKKKMGLVNSITPDAHVIIENIKPSENVVNDKPKIVSIKKQMGPALFTLQSTSNDIEYPTSNSILKTQDLDKSEVFTSELYESCVLSFSIVEIMENISVGLTDEDEQYYGINFQKDKFNITFNEETEFDYDTGDIFKIIHLSHEINIFKNERKIYTSNKKTKNSVRALFTLFNKEDEIRNIQFYYIHQSASNYIKQGSTIVLINALSNDIRVDDDNSFYLLEGVSSIISGFTEGKNGQYITIINNSGNKQIFSDNDEGSILENRLYLGSSKIEIIPKTSIRFLYVSDLSKWVLL